MNAGTAARSDRLARSGAWLMLLLAGLTSPALAAERIVLGEEFTSLL